MLFRSCFQWYTEDGKCNIKDPAWQKALETRKMLDDEGIQMPYGQIVAAKAAINSSFLGGKEAMVTAGSWLVRDKIGRASCRERV